MSILSNRENVLRALRRQQPEKIPFEFVLCPLHIENLYKKVGTRDYHEYFNFPIRYVELNPTKKKTDFTVFYDHIPENTEPLYWNPEWGILGTQGSTAHFQEMLHPMEKFRSIEQIEKYPFPDFNEPYRWENVSHSVKKIKQNDLVAVAFMQMTIFEISWYLRGMDTFIMDMVTNTDFAEALMDKITTIRIDMAKRYAQCGTDILMLGDDVSTQEAMMISPDLWRRLIKSRLANVVMAAKEAKPDILVFYHGDGNIEAIIPDLIEVGIDILNPIQPECMDPIKLKKLYGDKLSFWGTIGTQTTMPFGTAQQVRQTCQMMIEQVGKGGGLLLAPTHMLEPDVPWQNIEAFIGAVEQYGQNMNKKIVSSIKAVETYQSMKNMVTKL